MSFKIEHHDPSQHPLHVPLPKKAPLMDQAKLIERLPSWAMVWLLAQGLVHVFATSLLANWLRLRWTPDALPLLRALGTAQVTLAFFIYYALHRRDPKDPLAVDSLLVYFLGKVWFSLMTYSSSGLTGFEWVTGLGDLLFALALAYSRNTRSLFAELWRKEVWQRYLNLRQGSRPDANPPSHNP
jgi:hypothetical protein